MIISYILLATLSIFLLYKNYKSKKIIKQLKREIINTHDFYREKYDYYLNFRERYHSILLEVQDLKNQLNDLKSFEKPVIEELVKPKRSRKKVE